MSVFRNHLNIQNEKMKTAKSVQKVVAEAALQGAENKKFKLIKRIV